MDCRTLGRTGLHLSPIGFGAFKIGRNENIKYAQAYDMPDDNRTSSLLTGVVDAGINFIDTAPAYGTSESRLGHLLGSPENAIIISTKVGETFAHGQSTYAFDDASVRASIERSRTRLNRAMLDIVFVHSDGRDIEIQTNADVVATLQSLKADGIITAIGFSGKTIAGARAALRWADAIMVEYHTQDQSHDAVMHEAREQGVGVIVKKGLASGQLPAADSIRFVLQHAAVTSLVIGGLNLDHIRSNVCVAQQLAETQ